MLVKRFIYFILMFIKEYGGGGGEVWKLEGRSCVREERIESYIIV